MKKFLFVLCLMPTMASAQTTTQKVLYMQVKRTAGALTTALRGTEDFVGPIYNLEEKKLLINGSKRNLSTIKEIRFEIRTEEVPVGVEQINAATEESATQHTYTLGGQRVDANELKPGIYVRGNKKIIKK